MSNMNDTNFKQWQSELNALDRYENPEDARTFSRLAESVANRLDARTIDVLLSTFCNDDDYGIQEAILTVLDSADTTLFAERLAANFMKIQSRASINEWPLILTGRFINSNSRENTEAMIAVAKAQSPAFYDFLGSEAFISEYPAIESCLRLDSSDR